MADDACVPYANRLPEADAEPENTRPGNENNTSTTIIQVGKLTILRETNPNISDPLKEALRRLKGLAQGHKW